MTPCDQLIHGYAALEAPWKHYRGISRDEWSVAFDALVAGNLDPSLRAVLKQMMQDSRSELFLPKFGRVWDEIVPLLKYTFAHKPDTDIVGFFSPWLERSGNPSWEEPRARFVGIDVVPVGEESLLSKLEQAKELSDSAERAAVGIDEFFARHINEHGLLHEPGSAEVAIAYYDKLVMKEWIEPYTREIPNSPEPVRVFLIADAELSGS